MPRCPARIPVRQTAIVDGWTVDRSMGTVPVVRIGFVGGPADRPARLAPTSRAVRGVDLIEHWTFAPRAGEIRLLCGYNVSDVFIMRPLPAGIRRCSVSTDRVEHKPDPAKVRCE